jgi:hypothetical protein
MAAKLSTEDPLEVRQRHHLPAGVADGREIADLGERHAAARRCGCRGRRRGRERFSSGLASRSRSKRARRQSCSRRAVLGCSPRSCRCSTKTAGLVGAEGEAPRLRLRRRHGHHHPARAAGEGHRPEAVGQHRGAGIGAVDRLRRPGVEVEVDVATGRGGGDQAGGGRQAGVEPFELEVGGDHLHLLAVDRVGAGGEGEAAGPVGQRDVVERDVVVARQQHLGHRPPQPLAGRRQPGERKLCSGQGVAISAASSARRSAGRSSRSSAARVRGGLVEQPASRGLDQRLLEAAPAQLAGRVVDLLQRAVGLLDEPIEDRRQPRIVDHARAVGGGDAPRQERRHRRHLLVEPAARLADAEEASCSSACARARRRRSGPARAAAWR